MLPTRSIAHPPGGLSSHQVAQAWSTPARQGTEDAAVTAFRDQVVTALRGGAAIEGRMLHVVLSLIPTQDDWTRGLQILLHLGGGSGQLYGAADDAVRAEPIHVKRLPDGSFAAGVNSLWEDRGAHRDSALEAVLLGLQSRNAMDHRLFTAPRQAEDVAMTDAQRLRERIARQLEDGHPASMRVLESLAPPEPRPDRPQRQPGRTAADAELLLKVSNLDPSVIRTAGIAGLARQLEVPPGSLIATFRADGKVSVAGTQVLQRQLLGMKHNTIDAPLLRVILQEHDAKEPRKRSDLALFLNVSVYRLRKLVTPQYEVTALGLDMLRREHRTTPIVLITPDFLRDIETRVKSGAIPTEFDLLDAADEANVSFDALLRLVSIVHRRLTPTGKRFLADGLPHLRSVQVDNVPRPAGVPHPDVLPVTAELLLGIWEGGRPLVLKHRGLRNMAKISGVSPDALKKRVHARTGTLTEWGERTVLDAYPDFRFDRRPSPGAPIPSPDPMAAPPQKVPVPPTDPGAAAEVSTTGESAPFPSDLIDLRAEDLLFSVKRPRLDP